jgi:hypothetical protein
VTRRTRPAAAPVHPSASRRVVLERQHQEVVAAAQALCHTSRVRLARLQAPPVAVLLTIIRACDLATVIEVDLGDLQRRP